MESTVSVMDTEPTDEGKSIEECNENNQTGSPAAATDDNTLQENTQHQQRQDFTSESFKIEVSNMGKFSFGVCNSFQIYNQ